MMEVGQVCIKIAGRDAGKKGAIVEVLSGSYVIVDGQVRRKKCNIRHLEPLKEKIKIEKKTGHEAVVAELKKIGIEVTERKSKQKTEKPKKARKTKKAAPATEKKAKKTEAKKTEKPAKKVAKKKTNSKPETSNQKG